MAPGSPPTRWAPSRDSAVPARRGPRSAAARSGRRCPARPRPVAHRAGEQAVVERTARWTAERTASRRRRVSEGKRAAAPVASATAETAELWSRGASIRSTASRPTTVPSPVSPGRHTNRGISRRSPAQTTHPGALHAATALHVTAFAVNGRIPRRYRGENRRLARLSARPVPPRFPRLADSPPGSRERMEESVRNGDHHLRNRAANRRTGGGTSCCRRSASSRRAPRSCSVSCSASPSPTASPP